MTDYAVVPVLLALVFVYEIKRAGKSYLAEIPVKLLLRHADAVVGNGYRPLLLVSLHGDLIIVGNVRHLTERGQPAQLCHRVAGVRHYLAQENVLVGIKPFLDYRENMLRLNGYPAFFDFFIHVISHPFGFLPV